MTFDDDVLSAIEEAFGAGSAAMVDDLDLDCPETEPNEDLPETEGLETLIDGLDQEIRLAAAGAQRPAARSITRRRSLDEKHVLISLEGASFGFPIRNVLEIHALPPATFLPHLPPWILGVCNLRGNIVSLLDLNQLIGLPETKLAASSRLVIVANASRELTTGIVVDDVLRIAEFEPAQIKRPVGQVEGPLGQFLKGTIETSEAIVCVMDLEQFLNSLASRTI